MPDRCPALVRIPKVIFVDDGEGKPVGIHKFIGRRPILAVTEAVFGNSDGDHQMLQWTAAGDDPRFHGSRPSHRRRTKVGLRPRIGGRATGQGAGRGTGEGLDCRGYEARLAGRLPLGGQVMRTDTPPPVDKIN